MDARLFKDLKYEILFLIQTDDNLARARVWMQAASTNCSDLHALTSLEAETLETLETLKPPISSSAGQGVRHRSGRCPKVCPLDQHRRNECDHRRHPLCGGQRAGQGDDARRGGQPHAELAGAESPF